MQPVFAILIPAHVSAAAAGVTQIENGDAGLSLMGQNQSSEKQKKKKPTFGHITAPFSAHRSDGCLHSGSISWGLGGEEGEGRSDIK